MPFVLDHKGLRKLTEYECLKLQGFPKNYSVPKFDDMPRGKVYKMVGNSVSPRVSTLLSKSVFDYLSENLNVNKLSLTRN